MQNQSVYIWIGIDVEEQLLPLKEQALAIEKNIGLTRSTFTIPLHISLKISFEVPLDVYQNVVDDIVEIYQTTRPFTIDVKGIECEDIIVWVRMQDNADLRLLQDRLNQTLLAKYGIPLHPYDLDYKFHTTLYMDDDKNKIAQAYQAIKDTPLPKMLMARPFLIGTSPSGKFGTYQVQQWIPAQDM